MEGPILEGSRSFYFCRPVVLNLRLRHTVSAKFYVLPIHDFPQRGIFMIFDLYLGGLIAFGLALYLGYALIYPEKF